MKWKYIAKDFSGRTIKGVVESTNANGVAGSLREQKLVPISISPAGGLGFSLKSAKGKIGIAELSTFTRQLATMITAGLPLTDALNLLKVQSGPVLAKVVGVVLTDVQSGMALSTAMAKHPQIFSKVYVALVKAGEAAGVMETILVRLAESSEKSREFRSKVAGAMIYPVIIVIGMIGVTALMIIVVIPKISALYADFNTELPFATKFLIAISGVASKPTVLAIIGVLLTVVILGVGRYLKSAVGRLQWDSIAYKIPVMGGLSKEVMLTELTRTLSLLIGAGISVVEALNIVAGAVGNVVVEKDIRRISSQVEKGFPVSISFSESPIFPTVIGQMAAVGEETGKMDDVMIKLSRYFESESEQKVKGLTTAIEPIILIVLAVGVGFLMYAIVMPIYSITNKF